MSIKVEKMFEILIQDMEENQSEKNQKYRWVSSHEMDCVTRYFRQFFVELWLDIGSQTKNCCVFFISKILH